MNTRSRITLSTVLGLTLVGFCLGSAQAQSGTKRTTHNEMKHEKMDEDSNDEMMADYMTPEPAPINYPFAAPGGVHLYHWTDYTHEALSPDSSYSKHLDNEYRRERMMRRRLREEDAAVHGDAMVRDPAMIHDDRMPREGYYMTDENGMLMREEMRTEPAPLGYPFAAPGGLHLYHFTDYSREGIAEGSATIKKMEHEEMDAEMMRQHRRYYGSRMVDENDMTMFDEMTQPAPIGYPFSAPGGLHLYHYTDFSQEGIAEGSATMKKTDNEEKRERARANRMKQNQTPK